MKPIYLKIKDGIHNAPTTKTNSLWKTFLIKVISTIIPKANPDFDNKIDLVDHWLIEFVGEIPNREIGIKEGGETSMILPWRNNYGFLTDSNLRLNDFINSFNTTEISEKEFNNRWDVFEEINGKDN